MKNDNFLERFRSLFKKENATAPAQRDSIACIIYTRVSGKKQIERASLEIQYRCCMELAEKKGWKILDVRTNKNF